MGETNLAVEPLSEIESQFKILADSAPVLIWISGPDKLCYFFNQGWLSFTGKTAEEEAGNGWAKGIHPDDLHRCLDIYERSFDKRQPFKMEYRLRRFDGQYRWLLDHGVPSYLSDGRFAGYIGSCIDVDDKIQAERALERKVHERTEQLQHVIEQLERSNQELEQFAYAASHDMKDPLRKIHVYASLLLQEPEKAVGHVAKIQSAADRMTTLMDDMLDLSRVRKNESLFTVVDLNLVIEEVKKDLELVINDKKARISCTPLPQVLSIAEQMRQLFFNLLSNALKYVEPDVVPEIKITAQPMTTSIERLSGKHDPNLQYIEISVKDNGIGFSQQHAERVFTIFQRLNPKARYPGTGVGLALCKKVIQNHDGAIWAVSEPGKGATFSMLIPRCLPA